MTIQQRTTMADMMRMLTMAREIHAPAESFRELKCGVCAEDEWPCSTAMAVYAYSEVREIMYWWRIYDRWMKDVWYRRNMASGWSVMDDLYRVALKRMASERFLIDRLLTTSG